MVVDLPGKGGRMEMRHAHGAARACARNGGGRQGGNVDWPCIRRDLAPRAIPPQAQRREVQLTRVDVAADDNGHVVLLSRHGACW